MPPSHPPDLYDSEFLFPADNMAPDSPKFSFDPALSHYPSSTTDPLVAHSDIDASSKPSGGESFFHDPSFFDNSPSAYTFTQTSLPFSPIDVPRPPPPLPPGYQEASSQPGTSGSDINPAPRADGMPSSMSPPSSSSASANQGYPAARYVRYSPMAKPDARRSARLRNRMGKDDFVSDDEQSDVVAEKPMDAGFSRSDTIQRNREEKRRNRFESEQRQRKELRDGYAKLKDTLPSSNQKSSKVSLLDRAVTRIRQLETSQETLQARVDEVTKESERLRNMNLDLMRNISEQHKTVMAAAQVVSSARH